MSTEKPAGPNTIAAGAQGGTISQYQDTQLIGEGTYGHVFLAFDKATGVAVALKKIRVGKETEGFPITSTREIKMLRRLPSPFIVKLLNIVWSTNHVYLAFEYMEYDLVGLMHMDPPAITAGNVRYLGLQLINALNFLHSQSIAHRDIKASNILVNRQGKLKLADFGLAKLIERGTGEYMTNRVITLWYRPPELLLGAVDYGCEVDLWSAGCILMEMTTKKPLFLGKDEITQLIEIMDLMGSLEKGWPEYEQLPLAGLLCLEKGIPSKYMETYADLDPELLDLCCRLLDINPSHRICAEAAAKHPFFHNLKEADRTIRFSSSDVHEFEVKRKIL